MCKLTRTVLVLLWYSNGHNRRLYGAWIFPRAGFLDLAGRRIVLGKASGLLVRVVRNLDGHFALRFVVKSGGGYHLSQSASNAASTFILSGTRLRVEMWARCDPAADLRAGGSRIGTGSAASNLTAGAGSLEFDIPTSAFSDIEAVGLYAESVDTMGWPNRLLDFDRFQVQAEAGD